jgi:hypothetical protein
MSFNGRILGWMFKLQLQTDWMHIAATILGLQFVPLMGMFVQSLIINFILMRSQQLVSAVPGDSLGRRY